MTYTISLQFLHLLYPQQKRGEEKRKYSVVWPSDLSHALRPRLLRARVRARKAKAIVLVLQQDACLATATGTASRERSGRQASKRRRVDDGWPTK
jgi:hypothetical protein